MMYQDNDLKLMVEDDPHGVRAELIYRTLDRNGSFYWETAFTGFGATVEEAVDSVVSYCDFKMGHRFEDSVWWERAKKFAEATCQIL